MRENDIRAIVSILDEIKNNKVLSRGFEELLRYNNYSDLNQLTKNFQKICDIMDEWNEPGLEIAIMQEINACFIPIEIEKPRIKLAVAGSYNEYKNYCTRRNIAKNQLRYIPHLDFLRGHRDCDMVLIGSYYMNLDCYEIQEYCESHNIRRY